MKFKKLNEEFTSDDLYQVLIDYIYEKLEHAVDNLAIEASSDIEDYDADYCSEEVNQSSQYAYNKLRQAAEYFAEFLLWNAPEVIHESLNEDVDASQFVGKPLRDFLKTIDHRTKINVQSEAGFDDYGNKGGHIGGLNGLAHDVNWYMADMIIKDIKQPTDHKYWEYDILVEDCEKNESLKESSDLDEIRGQIQWCKSVLENPKGRLAMDAKANYGKDYLKRTKEDLKRFEILLKKYEKNESLNEMARMPDRINPKLQRGTKVKLSPKAFKLYGNDSVSISDGFLDLKGKVGTVKGYDIDWVPEKMILIRVDFDGKEWNFGPQDLVVVKDESLLTEKNWKHQLPSGAKLRKAIDDEDYATLKSTLMDCYREINQLIPDDFEEYELEDKLEELEILDTEPDEEIDIDEQDVEDNWNYELDTFYDICDAYNIWIPLE